jgi:gas vesicle protein
MNEYQRYGDYSQQVQERSGGAGAGSIITFLLIGAGVGAIVALLLAPNSGTDLRDGISRRFRRTVDNVSARTQDLRERGSNLLGFTREAQEERRFGQG